MFETIALAKKSPMEAVLRMAFTGRHERLSAQRAYGLGICSQVVDPPEDLEAEAQALGELIARNSPAALAHTKRALLGRAGTARPMTGKGVEIGTAIVSYIEPHPGHEVAFNRWYELDHFPATVKAGPGVFAGARFVATRACKDVRPPGRLFGDPARGSYLAVAWVLPGKQAEWDEWVGKEMQTIAEQDRLFPYRDHVHTAVYRCLGRTDDVAAVVALDRGHGGVVVAADEGRLALSTASVEALVLLTLERTIVSQAEPPPHNVAPRVLRRSPRDVRDRRRHGRGGRVREPVPGDRPRHRHLRRRPLTRRPPARRR